MAKTKDDLSKLKELLHAGRLIIDDRQLYFLWDYIPKGHEKDWSHQSFNQAVVQGWRPQAYTEWQEKIEDYFLNNNLDFLKLKMLVMTGDIRQVSKEPAAVFVRMVKAVDAIVSDPALLASYRTAQKQAASWPPVLYENGVVSQGARSHRFTDPKYSKLLDYLWQYRFINSPTGQILLEGEVKTRKAVNTACAISDHERFTGIVKGIRKAMTENSIELKIHYPDDVRLTVLQSRK